MKRFFLIAVGLVLLMIAVTEQPLKAQIYGEYDTVKVIQPSSPIGYIPLTSPYTVISPNSFKKPSAPNLPPTIIDRDNGYYKVPLGFSFEFNGEVYSEVWVCVNGFITFSQPVYVESTNPEGLFFFGSSYQINVVAPYWGNHFLVTAQDTVGQGANRHLPGEISYKMEGTAPNRVFTVQWKNLYINLQTPLLPGQLPPLKNGIGNFQVKLLECPDPYSRQGDIEFCYGQVEGNPFTTEDQVITRDATVGIKGESNVRGSFADFMNALYFDQAWTTTDDRFYSPDSTRTGLKKTNAWQPSGGSDRRIHYYAIARLQSEFWGDGDADMSKLPGKKHGEFGQVQNRYVTFSDARLVMRSVVTSKQLDSVRKRNAYHGDVNHNGRYFYRDTGILKSKVNPANDSLDPYTGDPVHGTEKTAIPWKNIYYGDSLSYIKVKDALGNDTVIPTKINSLKMVFFQVTAFDAAIMIDYMAGRLESLPYLLDSTIIKGKISFGDNPATNIIAGMAERLDADKYIFPVYVNGTVEGPVAFTFDVNGVVKDVTVANKSGNTIFSDFADNKVVVSGSGTLSADAPVAFVTVSTNKSDIQLSGITYNDNETGRQTIYLSNVEVSDNDGEILLQNHPNPLINSTEILVNVVEEGNYKLAIYDALGNKVKTLFEGTLKSGQNRYEWNGTDDNGNIVANGSYIYRLTGQNVSASRKLILNK